MTHDKLLAKINYTLSVLDIGILTAYLKALRAVVELHKPPTVFINPNRCNECLDKYPCPTIQAIEKELK